MKVYGPYTRQDGRQHVILYENGKRTTVSYPKYLMQIKLNRKLERYEVVDHIDDNCSNNNEDNFQIISHRQNMNKYHVNHTHMYFMCPMCGKEFHIVGSQYRNNQVKQNKSGPFCSRLCAGIHNTNIQNGRDPLYGSTSKCVHEWKLINDSGEYKEERCDSCNCTKTTPKIEDQTK